MISNLVCHVFKYFIFINFMPRCVCSEKYVLYFFSHKAFYFFPMIFFSQRDFFEAIACI
jgi:hypothetical protein